MVLQADISSFSYFLPIFVFLFVFVVMYALLAKLKILGENRFVHLLVSLIIAIIFVVFSSAREIVIQITPWFAVLIVLAFFILMLVGLTQKSMESFMKPWLAWVFIIVIVLVFLGILLKVLGLEIIQTWQAIASYPRLASGVLLLVLGAIVAWMIARK